MNDPYLVIEYNYEYNNYGGELDSVDISNEYYESEGDAYTDSYYGYYDDDGNLNVMSSAPVGNDMDKDSPLGKFLVSNDWAITKTVVYSFAMVTIIVSNILLLVVIRKVRYLKTTSNRYVVTLAVADILTGVYTTLQIAETLSPRLRANLYMCLGVQLGWMCLATVTQLLTLFLTFDCYFSLWHPITYSQVLTALRANVAILLAWLYGAGVALLPLVWVGHTPAGAATTGAPDAPTDCHMEAVVVHKYLVFFLTHYCVALVIAGAMFVFVYYEIQTSKVVLKVYKKRKKQRQVYEERRKKDVQNAHCMTVVVGLYFVFWLPYYVLLGLHMHYRRTAVGALLDTLATVLVVLRAALAPAVYVCRLHTFQIACYKVLCCLLTSHFPSRPPSDSVQLRSLSFRNQATGSMMSLHTTIGSDGKVVRMPHTLLTDYERSQRGGGLRPHRHGSLRPNNYHHPSGRYPPIDESLIDVWVTPDSPDFSLGVTREVYRSQRDGHRLNNGGGGGGHLTSGGGGHHTGNSVRSGGHLYHSNSTGKESTHSGHQRSQRRATAHRNSVSNHVQQNNVTPNRLTVPVECYLKDQF